MEKLTGHALYDDCTEIIDKNDMPAFQKSPPYREVLKKITFFDDRFHQILACGLKEKPRK